MKILKVFILAKNNLPILIKALFFSFLVLSLFVALVAVVFNVQVDSDDTAAIGSSAKNVMNEFFSSPGDFSGFTGALADLEAKVQAALPDKPGVFMKYPSVSLLFIIAVVYLWKFVNGLSDLPALQSFNDFMTTSRRRHFSWFFLKYIGKSCLFQLNYLLITFFLDIVAILSVIGAYGVFLIHLGIYGAIGGMAFFAVIYSLRLSFFSYWSVSIISEDMKIFDSLKHSVCILTKNFGANFLFTLTVISVSLISVFSALYFINNIYGLVIVSICGNIAYYLIKCMNMAYYYDAANKAYFTHKLEIDNE